MTVTLSRPDPGWTGACGYVQEHLEECFDQSEPFDEYIVCGSTAMVDAVRARLGQLGIRPESIKSEGHG